MRKPVSLCLAVAAVAVLAACEGKPPREPNINWKPATIETYNQNKGTMAMLIVCSDGTKKVNKQLATMLGHEQIEKAAQRFVCMKVDLSKADDPLVKEVKDIYDIKKVPALVFIRSNGIPGGLIMGGRLPAEIVTQMMQVP
jgi:hypothetical protein